MKAIPKEHTVFRFHIPLKQETASTEDPATSGEEDKASPSPLVLELHGSSFQHRAPDRATRKFVLHLPDL
jgi:ribonuclease P protein subunit POP4